MNNVSNRTLVYLLMVAIVISLVGTLVSLSKLGELGITGYDTANITGEVELNIGGTCAISMSGSNVNFETGPVNESNCVLNTSGTGSKSSGCGPGIVLQGHGLNFTNDGNENISLNITINESAATLFGGNSPSFKINASAIESGACNDGNFALQGWNEVSKDAPVSLCNDSNRLDYTDSKDTLEINIYLDIPNSADQGGGPAEVKLTGICP